MDVVFEISFQTMVEHIVPEPLCEVIAGLAITQIVIKGNEAGETISLDAANRLLKITSNRPVVPTNGSAFIVKKQSVCHPVIIFAARTLVNENLNKDMTDTVPAPEKPAPAAADVELLSDGKAHRKMAWVSLLATIGVTLLLMFVIPTDKLKNIEYIITWFYTIMGGIVLTEMGVSGWLLYLKK